MVGLTKAQQEQMPLVTWCAKKIKIKAPNFNMKCIWPWIFIIPKKLPSSNKVCVELHVILNFNSNLELNVHVYECVIIALMFQHITVEPFYNEDLGTMKATLLYQVSHYIRVNKHNDIKRWNQQSNLVISGILLYRSKKKTK